MATAKKKRSKRKRVLCARCRGKQRGSKNSQWSGGTGINRLVAEAKIGRPLEDSEQVHHIDGDPLNPHPDNLEVLEAEDHPQADQDREGVPF